MDLCMFMQHKAADILSGSENVSQFCIFVCSVTFWRLLFQLYLAYLLFYNSSACDSLSDENWETLLWSKFYTFWAAKHCIGSANLTINMVIKQGCSNNLYVALPNELPAFLWWAWHFETPFAQIPTTALPCYKTNFWVQVKIASIITNNIVFNSAKLIA